MKFKETKIVVILAVVFVLLGSVYAADLTVPHTFSPGTTAKSSEMNENLATIYWDADSAINSNPNQPIVVTEGQTVTDKNFQLEPGATISGTIFETDGVTPLTGKTIQINALAGSPCGSGTSVAYATVNSENGIYTIHSLPAGTYYLQASPLNDIREWWASPPPCVIDMGASFFRIPDLSSAEGGA